MSDRSHKTGIKGGVGIHNFTFTDSPDLVGGNPSRRFMTLRCSNCKGAMWKPGPKMFAVSSMKFTTLKTVCWENVRIFTHGVNTFRKRKRKLLSMPPLNLLASA